MPKWRSHTNGLDYKDKLCRSGQNVVIEDGVRVFFPGNVEIGDDVYIGHDTILKGYFDKKLIIGSGSWIGPQCFIYASGGIVIGRNVGIGPGVTIMSSAHNMESSPEPVLHTPIESSTVYLGDGCDIGANSVILMGVHIGQGAQIGAGTVVTNDIPDHAIAAGVPVKVLRLRGTQKLNV
jgi:acetyltransferase-like isoleucine patch superfamily enzyme